MFAGMNFGRVAPDATKEPMAISALHSDIQTIAANRAVFVTACQSSILRDEK